MKQSQPLESSAAPNSQPPSTNEGAVVPELGATGGVLREGSRFGAYIVGECIGQGGMARVYRAEHKGLQRQVALKVLVDGLGTGSDGHERFLREARIAAAIKHPNVVNIFDVGVHHGTPYLVMELLSGVDLDAFVESKGRLDEGTMMDIVVPIAGALAAVHDAGIVHRDLKPGNIFLARGRNDEIEPRLLDFGISKSVAPDQMKLTSGRGLVMGTPFYMSPEAARGAEMTPLSDQYALGVVLYECATGVNPFTGASSFAEVVQRVTTGEYKPVSSHNVPLSRRMVAIIERAMHLDPAQRFPDMRAMGRELLMLAGQRTRITWGLSFNELPHGAALARLSAEADAAVRPKRSYRGLLYAAPAVAVAVLAGAWFLGEQRAGNEARTAAVRAAPEASGATRELALRPNQGSAPLAEPSVEPASQPEPRAGAAEPALDDQPSRISRGAEDEPTERAASQPPAKAAARTEPAVRRPVRNERRPVAKARRNVTATASLPATSTPEWAPATREPVASTNAGSRGTNNAPILD